MKFKIFFLLLVMLVFGFLLWKNANQPQVIWKIDAKNIIENATLMGDMIYLSTLDNKFEAISANDGSIVWQQDVDSLILQVPIIRDDKIFVISKLDTVYEFNLSTGQTLNDPEIKQLNEKSFDYLKKVDSPNQGNYRTELKSLFPGDSSYTVLYALDPKTQQKKWQWPRPAGLVSAYKDSAIFFSKDFLYRVK